MSAFALLTFQLNPIEAPVIDERFCAHYHVCTVTRPFVNTVRRRLERWPESFGSLAPTNRRFKNGTMPPITRAQKKGYLFALRT